MSPCTTKEQQWLCIYAERRLRMVVVAVNNKHR